MANFRGRAYLRAAIPVPMGLVESETPNPALSNLTVRSMVSVPARTQESGT
jgi:hypothetical protein